MKSLYLRMHDACEKSTGQAKHSELVVDDTNHLSFMIYFLTISLYVHVLSVFNTTYRKKKANQRYKNSVLLWQCEFIGYCVATENKDAKLYSLT